MGTHDFERLIALYMEAAVLVDRAMVEAYVGDNAQADGHVTEASDHFTASRHYWQQAEKAEAEYDALLTSLADENRHTTSRRALADEAQATARERLYGTPNGSRRSQEQE